MKLETNNVNTLNMIELSHVLDQFDNILANKTVDSKSDPTWIAEMTAAIDRFMPPAATPVVLPMMSARSLANTLQDFTPVDPYGPFAMVLYRSRDVVKL